MTCCGQTAAAPGVVPAAGRDAEGCRRRHLLWFCCPAAHGDAWRYNADQLLARIGLFNGRRVAAVLTAPGDVVPPAGLARPPFRLDPPGAVRDALAGHGFDVVEVPDAGVGEAAAFGLLWESVAGYRTPTDITFYCHAKGTSYRPEMPAHIREWVRILYAANLDYFPLVRAQFRAGKLAVGSMRQATGPKRDWIYSGAFYWFRNRAAFARDWRAALWHHYTGVERWPGRLFRRDEAACLFKDYEPGLQAYDPTWMGATAAEFQTWSDANAAHRTVTPEARLRVFAFYHDRDVLAEVPDRPWVVKGHMPDLSPQFDPRLGEGRLILSPVVEDAGGAEYVGGVNGRAHRKYADFRWEDFEARLRPHLHPGRVVALWPTGRGPVPTDDWLRFSEAYHPGMAAPVRELCAAVGIEICAGRPSLWANDFVCHRDVWRDWLNTYRRAATWAVGRWGYDPPFADPPDGRERKVAYLLERVTTAYFAARADLAVVPL
jgi:hypothetical protein